MNKSKEEIKQRRINIQRKKYVFKELKKTKGKEMSREDRNHLLSKLWDEAREKFK